MTAVVSQQLLQCAKHDGCFHMEVTNYSTFLSHNYDIELTGHGPGKLMTNEPISWGRLRL